MTRRVRFMVLAFQCVLRCRWSDCIPPPRSKKQDCGQSVIVNSEIMAAMDRLQSMRVFQQVVDEGGFAAAARKMDLAPAVVTRLVSDLEQHLGVRLLQRTTRRMSLTQAGETYLERLRTILAEIDDADAIVQAQTKEMRGTIRVLAPPVAAAHTLAPAVVGFQKLHPSVIVDVHVGDAPDPAVHEY